MELKNQDFETDSMAVKSFRARDIAKNRLM